MISRCCECERKNVPAGTRGPKEFQWIFQAYYMAVAKTFPNVLVIVHECVCGCVLVWAESNKSFLYSIIVPILGHTN